MHIRFLCRFSVMTAGTLGLLWGTAAAQGFTRAGRQDVYGQVMTINGKQFDYRTDSGLVPLSMDTAFLGGIGFGFHFDRVFSLRFETQWGNTWVRGKGPATGTTREVAMTNGMFILDAFLLDRPVSPFVSAGAGWQYVEAQLSNISTPVAYYDPWWGYTTVTNAYPTYSETDFVPSLGLGVRWDVTPGFFLRVSADTSWINYVNVGGTSTQTRYGITAGASY